MYALKMGYSFQLLSVFFLYPESDRIHLIWHF